MGTFVFWYYCTSIYTVEQLKELGIELELDSGIELEVLVIDIPNFHQVQKHFLDKTIWFNMRLFTFDVTSDLPLV